METQEQCTREDLLAIVPRYDRYSTKGGGEPYGSCEPGVSECDITDVEEYVCDSCGEYFTAAKRYDLASLDAAWRRALAHFPKAA